MLDTLIIGAGQAGLATAYHLQKMGLDFLLLEAGEKPQGSWPTCYESLKLFSPAGFSSLPGFSFPGNKRRHPSRDEVSQYLQDYAQHFQFPIQTSSTVIRIEPQASHFQVVTHTGQTLSSRTVVVASGPFNRPHLPHLPGQEHFKGHILHSSQYQSPHPFKGKRMVVVGAGNSALQIALELSHQASVTLATREKVRFAPQRILGLDFHHFLALMDSIPLGHLLPLGNSRLVLDGGQHQTALKFGQIRHQKMFQHFTEDGVCWENRETEQVDGVIFATGFRPNLPFLEGTPALDAHGQPLHRHGISTTLPGLAFVGLPGQRSMASATLRGVGRDARVVVQHLKSHLRHTQPQPLPL
ncbi:flavin-containing monooxygenase [Deinococcus misasensis]|uniref:flavin-containing monooxygenase n=1 Tax=Deinococcus misasensis TaxID=392413 RepID=UPI0005547C73|nr:NAD(P)/FAD-dependent oxidoreductase [Deinococcus misasensis]